MAAPSSPARRAGPARVPTPGYPAPGGSPLSEEPAAPVTSLGSRLKLVRLKAGLSLREVARQLGVSPSFVSQLENGKSQPSVATLYSISQLLDVSIDELFSVDVVDGRAEPRPAKAHGRKAVGRDLPAHAEPGSSGAIPISRSELGSPADAWPSDQVQARLSVTRPGRRVRLEMDSGVIWEQLATNTGTGLDFMEIVYPPHSS